MFSVIIDVYSSIKDTFSRIKINMTEGFLQNVQPSFVESGKEVLCFYFFYFCPYGGGGGGTASLGVGAQN